MTLLGLTPFLCSHLSPAGSPDPGWAHRTWPRPAGHSSGNKGSVKNVFLKLLQSNANKIKLKPHFPFGAGLFSQAGTNALIHQAAGQAAQCRGTGWCPAWGHWVGREDQTGQGGSHQTPSAAPQHSQACWNLLRALHRLQSLPEKRQRGIRTRMDENLSPRGCWSLPKHRGSFRVSEFASEKQLRVVENFFHKGKPGFLFSLTSWCCCQRKIASVKATKNIH